MAQPVLTREQVRRVDRLAVERLKMPSILLMENAGRGAADAIELFLLERGTPLKRARVAVVCGGGNNGGDGYTAARHLAIRGAKVTLYAARDPDQLEGDARAQAEIAQAMGLEVRRLDRLNCDQLHQHTAEWEIMQVVVDGLLGTGFTGPVREDTAAIIDRINHARTWQAVVAALDVPSGLDCDTGQPANTAVRADLTVTFAAAKIGFARAGEYVGKVVVADIGVPPSLLEMARREQPR